MHNLEKIYINHAQEENKKYIYEIRKQNMTNEMPLHYKKNYRHHIPGIIINNIMCSLFIDNHGGMLLLITKIGHTV